MNLSGAPQETMALSFDAAAPMLLSKENIQSFADKFIENVNEGYTNPLETAAIISGLEAAIKAIKDGIRETVLTGLKEGGKGSYQGVKIETMEAGGRYDFSTCGDVIYDELKQRSDSLLEDIKSREILLKAIPKAGMDIMNEETGEMYKVFPPAKPATTSTYKITIPKA